ncbi:DUF5926 family protein [Ruania halotolerans]|uniref:DUF5926 family protein n=1 Tax=Ruania halotolerans TaxID=2897773 RepID=UPI001E5289FD|nr:DUF5926 family protein [Ruania halotolerans]UFU08305.1 DUF5926 family protein [Ruania halotolerans]
MAAPRRSFDGLPGEADWVAMREVVPAASATARTNAEYGSREVTVVTVLPGLLPAMHREDGRILVALQNVTSSGDPSRDVAAALLQVLDSEPGTSLTHLELPGPGPRLQDVLDTDAPFEVTLHDTFDFVLPPDTEPTPELTSALEEFAGAIVPTVKLTSVPSAYWCRMGAREFLRWSRTEDEEALLDALARLHAARASAVDDGARFIGAFRSCGLVVPVWELAAGTEAEELESAAPGFAERLSEALAVTEPLNADERRARAGIVSRQVTLR